VDLPVRSPVRPAAALRADEAPRRRATGAAAAGGRCGRARWLACAALGAFALLPAAAGAQAPAPPAAPAAVAAQPRPVVDAVTCRTSCLGIARGVPGSVIRVSGDGMSNVTSVILLGRRGARDDVTVPATPVSPTAVEATMPPQAHGGPVRAIAASGRRSLRSRARVVIGPPGSPDPGGPVVEAKALTRKLIFEGGRTATVSFYVRGAAPIDVVIDVVRASDRVAVAHAVVPAVAPQTVQSFDWDGTVAGVAQPDASGS
jgi:hypothetical protein